MNQNNYDMLVQSVVESELKSDTPSIILRCTKRIQDQLKDYPVDKKFIKRCVRVCLGVVSNGNGIYICQWDRVQWTGNLTTRK